VVLQILVLKQVFKQLKQYLGDVVGAMDDAAIGTVTNIASGTEFTVDAVGGALADDDEIVNLTPLTIILSFER